MIRTFEKSKKVEQKAAEELQKVKDQGFWGKILTEGFPPLDSGPLFVAPSEAQNETVPFELSANEIELPQLERHELKEDVSLLWKSCRDWRGETAIRTIAKMALIILT
ncbi:hypothetical protein MP638_000142 [Amoeboaphelidium occidentale]|nr:hypothetical protein MP638_000142 [Amoeboaphelidium occidentale]